LANLPMHIAGVVWRRTSVLIQYIFVFLLVVPVLLIRRKISLPVQLVSGHDAVLVVCERLVAKVAISRRSTVLIEYANAQRMRAGGSAILACTPSFLLLRGKVLTCLIAERFERLLHSEVLDCAVEVRRKLDSAGLKLRGSSLDRYPQVNAGLAQIAQLFGHDLASRMRTLVQGYLTDGYYHTGLCHGDFHSRNIMRDEHGELRIIDLDCVRFEGIVELDPLYFALELEWSLSGALWLDTLATAFDSHGDNIQWCLSRFKVRWNAAFGLVYFLDRLGQEEINFGFKYPKLKIQRAVAAFQCIDNGSIHYEAL
jgi:hypothetical protein